MTLTEAALMPAQPHQIASHFVPVEAEVFRQPAAPAPRGSGVGRSILKAKGIQLPGAAAMRSMAGVKAQRSKDECAVYPAESLIKNDL